MRSRRNFLIGLGGVVVFLLVGFLNTNHVFAAPSLGITEAQIKAAASPNVSAKNFYFLGDKTTIEGNFGNGAKVLFKDNGDGSHFYATRGAFCNDDQGGVSNNYLFRKDNNNDVTSGGSVEVFLHAGGSTNQNCSVDPVKGLGTISIGFKISPPTSDKTGYFSTSDSINNINSSDISFINGSQISLKGLSTTPIIFTDSNPLDGTHNFLPPGGTFCGGSKGITFSSADIESDPLGISLDIAYYDLNDLNKCKTTTLGRSISNPGKIATKILTWSGSKISVYQTNTTFTPQAGDATGTIYLKSDSQGSVCGGGMLLVLDAKEGNSGTLYKTEGGDKPYKSNSSLPQCTTVSASGQKALIDGAFAQTLEAAATTTDDCVTDSGFDWLICPIVHGLSKTTDVMNTVIQGQLNFNTDDNLGDSVKAAWAIFKNLVSVIIVIVLLIMILSQAAGDLISAYTFKKLLPKLIVAVIGMQISWDICIWAINLANDLGQGIGQLLAAPFGGMGALDLPSLINRLDPAWGAGVGITSTALVALLAPTLLFLYWPGLLIMLFTVSLSVLVGFVTLLARNAIIILAVILSPAAFLAYVLPGTDKYWKLWKDNFMKCLLLFPMVIAMIYGGRIFAWVSADLGSPGAFDLLAVMAGFFGPYFFLPKTFKWGGSLLSSAGRLIAENGAIKKTREFGTKELKETGERWSGSQSQYDPFDKKAGYGLRGIKFRGKNYKVPMVNGRILPRLASKSIMPTARGRALTVKKFKSYKEERDAEQGAYVDRQYEVADKQGIKAKHWKLGDNGKFVEDNNIDKLTGKPKKGVGSAKLALMRAMLHSNQRERKMATQKLFDTKSAIEGQSEGFSLDPTAWADPESPDSNEIQEYIKNELAPYVIAEWGLENLEKDANGQPIARWYMHPEVEALQKNNPQYWGSLGRGDWVPPVLMGRYTKDFMDEYDIGVLERDEKGNVTKEDEAVRGPLRGKRLRDADRMRYAIRDSYVGVDNLDKQPQGFFQEIARQNDPKLSAEFAGLLAGIASGGSSAVNELIKLSGGAKSSLVEDLNRALAPLRDTHGNKITIQSYIDAARENKPENIPQIAGAIPQEPTPAGGSSGGGGSAGAGGTSGGSTSSSSSAPGDQWKKSGRGYIFEPGSSGGSSGATPSLHSEGQPTSYDMPEVKISRDTMKQMGKIIGEEVGTQQFEQTSNALKKAGIGRSTDTTRDDLEDNPPPPNPEPPASRPDQPPDQPPPTP